MIRKLISRLFPIAEETAEVFPSQEPSKAEILDRMPSDLLRAEISASWAARAREEWYQGQAESVQVVLCSTSDQFKGLTPSIRTILGQQRWGKSGAAKDLAGAEQMYTRWSHMYADLAAAKSLAAKRIQGK